ncbi:Claspin [Schistosoma japonicum]|nr:Claspin [Schistosoma japonicum]
MVEQTQDSPSTFENSSLLTEASSPKDIAPESTVKKSYILPLDLVDSDSSDECNDNVDSPSSNQACSSDGNIDLGTNEDYSDETKGKVGRWTLSSGAAKKLSRRKSVKCNSRRCKPANMEEERLQIFSESQRIIREADVHLPVHKPKQFKCFSEFRQSLKGGKLNETENCQISSQDKLLSDCSTHSQTISEQPTRSNGIKDEQDNKPIIPQGCPVDCRFQPVDIDCNTSKPLSSNLKLSLGVTTETDVPTNLLPHLSTRKLKSDENDEFYIDLGEAIPTSKSAVTPNQLLARLKSHMCVSQERFMRGPIQYSIVTKVQSTDTEREELQIETVTHESSKESLTTVSASRKQWLEHRKILQEKIRQKRLEQYELRLKEEGVHGSKLTAEKDGEVSNSDEEWSVGDENDSEISEDSTAEEDETSDDTDSEEEGDDEDEDDDNVVVGNKKSSRHRPCLFADDEAEESENDDEMILETNDGMESEEVVRYVHSADVKQKSAYNKIIDPSNQTMNSWRNITKSYTPQKQRLQLDDFTDLPEETEQFKCFPSCNNIYNFPQRRPPGNLGPADVDLFASEYSSCLDRTMNPQSILASTRLDATTMDDENKTRFVRDSSSHSQWNNTPYELLYSQKPSSQLPNLHNISSQDTVLLSQETAHSSQLDPTLILSEEANSSTHSQVLHENRRHLFSGETVNDQSQAFNNITTKTSVKSFNNPDSQDVHSNRCDLFGGSISEQSQELMDSVNKLIGITESADSQVYHDNRRNLFAGSICIQSQRISEPEKSNTDTCVADSEIQNKNHDILFSESNRAQSQESLSEVMMINSVDNSEDSQNLRLFDLQETGLPGSAIPTHNSSRRRVLIFDDEEKEENKANSNSKPSLQPLNSPFKLTPEYTFPDNSLSEVLDIVDDNVEERGEDENSNIDDSDSNTVEAENREVSKDPDDITDAEDSNDNESSEGEVEEDNVEDEDDEEEVQRLTVKSKEVEKKKKFRMNDFVDEEAELSGDENERAYFMDDEDELILDDNDVNEEFADLITEDDSDIPSAGRLRRQIERVHHRLQTDQDLRELRYLKELYFEDGDLHTENGQVRQRRFRWRGLENDDISADQLNADNSDDNISSDEDEKHLFGPIDNWLRGPLTPRVNSSSNAANQSSENVDIDSDEMHSKSSNQQTNNDPDNPLLGSDEEKENSDSLIDDTSSTSVLSLGRKAFLKSQAKFQTQIIVRNKLSVNRGKTIKPSTTFKNHPISDYFLQPKSHNLAFNERPSNNQNSNGAIKNAVFTRNPSNDDDKYVKFTDVNDGSNDSKLQVIRHGSLLGRFTGSLSGCKPEFTQSYSDLNDDFDVSTSKSGNRRDPSHLSLLNKIGLSCFSVVKPQVKPEKIDSFDDNSTFNQKSQESNNLITKQKRLVDRTKSNSVLLSPPSLKRHRSTSVFAALL